MQLILERTIKIKINRKKLILIKATFYRDDIKFKKNNDIVLEANYLKGRLKRYQGFCNGNPFVS